MKNQADHLLDALVTRYRERNPRSAAHHQRSAKVSPGGVSSNLRAWEPYPLYFHRAEGAWIWDMDNHEYLDRAAAQGVLLVGHRNPIVVDAVRQLLERITVVGAILDN